MDPSDPVDLDMSVRATPRRRKSEINVMGLDLSSMSDDQSEWNSTGPRSERTPRRRKSNLAADSPRVVNLGSQSNIHRPLRIGDSQSRSWPSSMLPYIGITFLVGLGLVLAFVLLNTSAVSDVKPAKGGATHPSLADPVIHLAGSPGSIGIPLSGGSHNGGQSAIDDILSHHALLRQNVVHAHARHRRAVSNCANPAWLPDNLFDQPLSSDEVLTASRVVDMFAVTNAGRTDLGPAAILLEEATTVSFTFVGASSVLRNSFGYYLDDDTTVEDGDLVQLFPDLTPAPLGCLESGDTVTTPTLPAGKLGLYFTQGSVINGVADSVAASHLSAADDVDGAARHIVVLLEEGLADTVLWVGLSEGAGNLDFSAGVLRVTFGNNAALDPVGTAPLVRKPSSFAPRIVTSSETTMDIAWTAGSGNGAEITGFAVYVECESVPGGWALYTTIDDPDQRQVTIKGLQPDKEYRVGCTAINGKGEGQVDPSEPGTTLAGCNRLSNPSFEVAEASGLATGWQVLDHGYVTTRIERFAGSRSIYMANLAGQVLHHGANNGVVLAQSEATPVRISANSKASSVNTAAPSVAYAMFVDIQHTDGTLDSDLHLFTPGTHDWEEGVVLAGGKKPIQVVWISLVFRGVSGGVWFDDVSVCEDTQAVANVRCSSTGDPHFHTYDERSYEFQHVGHFHMTRIVEQGLSVQTRQIKAGAAVSTNSAAAIRFRTDGPVFGLYRGHNGDDPVFTVDGATVISIGAPGDESYFDSDSTSLSYHREGDIRTYLFKHADTGVNVEVVVHQSVWKVQYMDVHTIVPITHGLGTVDGLCGNLNMDKYDDIQAAGSTDIPLSDADTLDYSSMLVYADSWRCTSGEDILVLGDAVSSEEAELYTDNSFPPIQTPESTDINTIRTRVASEVCANKGVPPESLNQCIIDLLSTNDVGFATSAALRGTDFCRHLTGNAR